SAWTFTPEGQAVAKISKNEKTGNAELVAYKASDTANTNGTGSVTVEYTEGTYPAVTSAPFAVTIKPGAEPVDVRVLDYSPDQPTDTGTIKVGEEIFLTPEAQFKDDPHRWVDISDYPEPPLKWDFVADATEPGAVVKPITMGKVKG